MLIGIQAGEQPGIRERSSDGIERWCFHQSCSSCSAFISLPVFAPCSDRAAALAVNDVGEPAPYRRGGSHRGRARPVDLAGTVTSRVDQSVSNAGSTSLRESALSAPRNSPGPFGARPWMKSAAAPTRSARVLDGAHRSSNSGSHFDWHGRWRPRADESARRHRRDAPGRFS